LICMQPSVPKPSSPSSSVKIYHPQPVQIVAERFMEKDEAKQSHWFDLTEGQTIEALLLELGEERRVYVVTTAAPHSSQVHDRWPSIKQVCELPPIS
ncbi:MAG: hypothetical protein ACRD2L_05450, partial [Terriglobia bacterium]